MGIKGLTKLLADECPECIKECEMEGLTGRKVAVDASMAIYQFLVAVRSGGEGHAASMLTNEAGEVTSHIQGMFNRTIRMLSSGVKPCFVFDGKPPTMKSGELAKRTAKRAKATEDLKNAQETGNQEDVDKFQKRLVRATKQHSEDCKTLLKLMGVPVVEAPCEAEAQCAELAKAGLVYGTGTEDMDALTFQTPKLLRKMTFAAGAKQPIMEVDLSKVLKGLDLDMDAFIDLCILCGCDYCDSIKGIGPKTALNLIRKHGSLEKLLASEEFKKKYTAPEEWYSRTVKILKKNDQNEQKDKNEIEENPKENEEKPGDAKEIEPTTKTEEDKENVENKEATTSELEPEENKKIDEAEYEEIQLDPVYVEARLLFQKPDVAPASNFELKWTEPNEAGLIDFLVTKMQFNGDRVNAGIQKLKAARGKASQQRMDSFFKMMPSTNTNKRKIDPKKNGPNKKAAKGKGKPRR